MFKVIAWLIAIWFVCNCAGNIKATESHTAEIEWQGPPIVGYPVNPSEEEEK